MSRADVPFQRFFNIMGSVLQHWCDGEAKWNVRIGLSWLAWGCIKLPRRLPRNLWILHPTCIASGPKWARNYGKISRMDISCHFLIYDARLKCVIVDTWGWSFICLKSPDLSSWAMNRLVRWKKTSGEMKTHHSLNKPFSVVTGSSVWPTVPSGSFRSLWAWFLSIGLRWDFTAICEQNTKRCQIVAVRDICSSLSRCVVWTGDDRVFFFNPTMHLSVWEKPLDLKDRGDLNRIIEDPPHKRKKDSLGESWNLLEFWWSWLMNPAVKFRVTFRAKGMNSAQKSLILAVR